MNLFKGYVTYVMAAAAVVAGIWGYASGSMDNMTAGTVLWAGLTTFGVRRAIGE